MGGSGKHGDVRFPITVEVTAHASGVPSPVAAGKDIPRSEATGGVINPPASIVGFYRKIGEPVTIIVGRNRVCIDAIRGRIHPDPDGIILYFTIGKRTRRTGLAGARTNHGDAHPARTYTGICRNRERSVHRGTRSGCRTDYQFTGVSEVTIAVEVNPDGPLHGQSAKEAIARRREGVAR